jgi:hypothetical protein
VWQRLFPGHPVISEAQLGIGRAELGLGHVDAAIEQLEKAYATRTKVGVDMDPVDLANAELALAQALWARARPGDRERAHELATAARDHYGENDRAASDWLAAHPE